MFVNVMMVNQVKQLVVINHYECKTKEKKSKALYIFRRNTFRRGIHLDSQVSHVTYTSSSNQKLNVRE